MFKVEMSDTVEEHSGEKDGKPWKIRKQIGYLQLPSAKYPVKFSYQLRRDGAALKAGVYTLLPESIVVDRYGSLAIFPKLAPAVAAAPAARAS